jgi:hypothetical protein
MQMVADLISESGRLYIDQILKNSLFHLMMHEGTCYLDWNNLNANILDERHKNWRTVQVSNTDILDKN